LSEPARALVAAVLPRGGLGNNLLVWAKAVVFAHLNDLPLLTTGWGRVHIGPILRREHSARFYARDFGALSPLPLARVSILQRVRQTVVEPEIKTLSATERQERVLYVFNQMPTYWADPFRDIRDYRDVVRDALFRALSRRVRSRVERQPRPVIGVHVRLGDFLRLQPGQDFGQSSLTSTPMDYFTNAIEGIREVAGIDLPVTVFSDGRDDELAELLAMRNVQRAPKQPDTVDLLLLSRSRIIVSSALSSFSGWAGFIGDAPFLRHPLHNQFPVRPDWLNERYFEGPVSGPPSDWDPLLLENIAGVADPPGGSM